MNMLALNKPHKIITWKDTENTGAVGWIVLHNMFNNISGGGLFMHESATLKEVKDLAYTMSLKNTLQEPIFGGGKGGIRFNPRDPRAQSVLARFIKDNLDVIRSEWCTGGDLNTTTKEITHSISEISDIKTPFISLASMLEKNLSMVVNIDQFNHLLRYKSNTFFTIEDAVTGYSVFRTIEKCIKKKPKVVVQGFGKVGKAFCYYAQEKYDIVGICEKEWFIVDPNGLDIKKLLSSTVVNSTKKEITESQEDFLIRFLKQSRANVFCPCSARYVITAKVLDVLIQYTLLNDAYIISGANNVFNNEKIIQKAFKNNITVIPEWLSNSGSAILFMEALKYSGDESTWEAFLKNQITDRIFNFLDKAWDVANTKKINIYKACCYLAQQHRA